MERWHSDSRACRADMWSILRNSRIAGRFMAGIRQGALMSMIFFILAAGTALGSGAVATHVNAEVKATIMVEIPSDLKDLDLGEMEPGSPYVKMGTANIKANVPWQLIVKDTDPATSGHMREWTGKAYGDEVLKSPLKVRSDNEVVLPNDGCLPVKTGGRTGNEGEDIKITLIQNVDKKEEQSASSSYRMVISYIGAPAV